MTLNETTLKKIIKESILLMLQESNNQDYDDLAAEIVEDVCNQLIRDGFSEEEIENVGDGKNNPQILVIRDKLSLVFGNETIYEVPENEALVHVFPGQAKEAFYNWMIEKLGREPETIDLNLDNI